MNRIKPENWAAGLFFVLALIGLPLAGVMLAGERLEKYMEFPPLTRYVPRTGFSWPVFAVLSVLILIVILPFVIRVLASQSRRFSHSPIQSHSFPWWGRLGLILGAVAWVLAWTRFPWFSPLQHFTFSPLWLAYILVVNALTYRRTGHCMFRDRPRYFLMLFPVSAVFWWFFEYLNRFVQNWYYMGVDGLTPFQYFIFATLPFSTVLPAVLGTYELLESMPRACAGLDNFLKIKVSRPGIAACIVLVISCTGLAGIGVRPHYLFPLLWLAPLLIIISFQSIRGKTTVFSSIRHGDWRRIYLLALAALVCGFFWEMWNCFSLAKWAYAVPFVHRFRIFEMPVLGFAGYLPFGLECAVIADILRERLK